MQSGNGSPPIGARRVRTDLHTSENLYVQSIGRSRSNSPMHAGLLARHGHRKAASEPKGIPGGPVPLPTSGIGATSTSLVSSSSSSSTSTMYLSVSGGSGRPIGASIATLHPSNPYRQRSSSSGGGTSSRNPPKGHTLLATGVSAGAVGGSTTRSQLPARARLLTRRLQNNATPTNGSESPRSIDSLPRRTFSGSYKTATLSQFHNHNLANSNNNNNNGPGSLHGLTDSASTATNSAEDLTLLDKSLRNSMLQDVVHFKKELVRLRRILQEDEENLMMTDTLNPFENNNGQFFTTAAAAAVAACNNNNNNNSSSLSSGATDGQENGTTGMVEMNRQQQENVLIRESSVAALALLEDQRQELADLRRQVVYLQGEMTAKDRIIRQQQNMIEKLEADREKQQQQQATASATQSAASTTTIANETTGDINHTAETISTATQTERLRPVSFGGQEGLGSRSEHPTTPRNGLRTPTASNNSSGTPSSTPQQHHNHTPTPSRSAPSKTQISSVYTQLSSVRHSIAGASVPAISGGAGSAANPLRRTSVGSSHNLSSVGLSSNGTKPVRTTHIGTLAVTGRQHTTGDRIPVSSRHSGHPKLLASPIKSSVGTAGPATAPSNGQPCLTPIIPASGQRASLSHHHHSLAMVVCFPRAK
ncbi:hypothetical protein AND_009638 [Anopheles darlingi]|uniref:Uncharacterized protein n=1 Tax=Anopheles darlingi TaxID=43151 RepID=W5J350_ANODA|nr:hypothetical protein AND_009638 [Anopheles darlingi]